MTYTKTINGRQVFSTCATIQMPDGSWVSNPSDEQIESAGWEPWTPPVEPEPEPQPMTEPDMYEVIEAVKRILSTETTTLSDEEALNVAALFPTWASKEGEQVQVNERLWYDGKLYKVVQPHTIQEDWKPDLLPALYTEVSIEEWPPIPEVITAENAYMSGDRGTWKGQHYICNLDNCVWNPDQLPSAWEIQD